MDYLSTPTDTLLERYSELIEHVLEPYLTEQRKQDILIELGRLSFELDAREQERTDSA